MFWHYIVTIHLIVLWWLSGKQFFGWNVKWVLTWPISTFVHLLLACSWLCILCQINIQLVWSSLPVLTDFRQCAVRALSRRIERRAHAHWLQIVVTWHSKWRRQACWMQSWIARLHNSWDVIIPVTTMQRAMILGTEPKRTLRWKQKISQSLQSDSVTSMEIHFVSWFTSLPFNYLPLMTPVRKSVNAPFYVQKIHWNI